MNRSNPLPIHQFPNLIAEVARLRGRNEIQPHVSILVAYDELAPLLAVLGGFRAGDAHAISEILALLEEIADISEGDRELLTRYRDMAQAMEGSQ